MPTSRDPGSAGAGARAAKGRMMPTISDATRQSHGGRDLVLIALLLMTPAIGGCVRTVSGPQGVLDPVPVLVLEHGLSSSLVLPLDDQQNQVIRYAYGDYRYYALARRNAPNALAALFLPTDAALGRRVLPGPMDPAHIMTGVNIEIREVHMLMVERQRAAELVAHLEQMYRQGANPEVDSSYADLTFVRHPRQYWAANNSNRAMLEWLTKLGCQVEGWSPTGNWRIKSSPEPTPTPENAP
jgi:hypothetical protein